MTWLISDEARKHRAFREVWVAYLLGGLYLLLFKPVKNFMDKRAKHYQDMESAAVEREKATAEMEAAMQQRQAVLDAELDEKRTAAAKEAEAFAQQQRDAAKAQADKILSDAKETADETMRNFHKFGKANISVAEMEKERERLRKKMNATQNSMKTDTKKPKKAYKPSDFKLGESVKVLSMNLTGSVTSLPDSKGNVTVQMGILRSTVNISDLEIIDEAPAYSFAKRSRQTVKGKVKMG